MADTDEPDRTENTGPAHGQPTPTDDALDGIWQSAAPHVWMPYCQMQDAATPLAVVATDDVYLQLADGRRLIDGLGSWWTACHGYNHPHIRQAVARQLEVMPHVMFGGIHHPPALTLAQRLAGLLPGDLNRVFFSDSGSVSVEVALKMAVQYWLNQGQTGRHRFVSFHFAYHGDTAAAMSLCDPLNGMHRHFGDYLPSQINLPLPTNAAELKDLDRRLQADRQQIAAVVIEPLVQGAGGMRFHSPQILAGISELCCRHGLLLIADEIATGFGRTGSMFACQQADITPDIMCLSKALTGGTLPLAATVAREHVFQAFLSDKSEHALMHGPTYMANPLGCAAANASLDLFDTEPRLSQANAMEQQLTEELAVCRRFDGVVDVRCKGAIGVVQLDQLRHLQRLRDNFVANGVWLRPFRDVVYVTPPLTMKHDQLHQLCRAIVSVIEQSARW